MPETCALMGLTAPPTAGMRGCGLAMPCIMLRGSGGAVALDIGAPPAPSTGSSMRLSSELSPCTPCSRMTALKSYRLSASDNAWL